MKIVSLSTILTISFLAAACQEENPDFQGGSGGGGSNAETWVNFGGSGDGDSDTDADSDGDADVDAGDVDGCILTGEEGLDVGELAPDLTLYRCDDSAVQAHQLFCDSPVTLLYGYAEW